MVGLRLDPTITDLTAQTPASYRKGARPSIQVDAVVLHQTSFNRGETASRYLSVHAHFVVTQAGQILQLHPVEQLLWASSHLNTDSCSIEFVGNFRSDHRHWWTGDPGRHILGTAQIGAGRDLLMYLRDNYGIWNVFAHRQGENPNRRGNCPGPEIWYEIGEWALRELGFSDGGKDYKAGDGAPIPAAWRRPLDP